MEINLKCCDKPCFHDTGMTLTSNPPQSQERCCNCGAINYRSYVIEAPKGHGPYAPTPFGVAFVGPAIVGGTITKK